MANLHRLLLVMAGLLALAGCATTPRHEQTIGDRIAAGALAQVGHPYRYGGNGPEAFDCSGLVRFAHLGVGISVPRTTVDQFRAAKPVKERKLAAGDLLFFRIDSKEVSHVAIYLGHGRFVHAPQTGRPVETRPLEDEYYRKRLVGTGRLY